MAGLQNNIARYATLQWALGGFALLLTVIVYFAYRRKEVKGAGQIFRNIILPAIGVCFTVLLWVYLSAESTRYGIIWFVIGAAVLLWITRFFRRPLTINMGEAQE